MHKKKKTIISLSFILLIWYIISSLNIYTSYLLPSSISVFNSFIELVKSNVLIIHIISSMNRVFIGYGISLFIAIFLGMITLFFTKFMDYFDWIIKFLKVVPPLSLIPLIILWFGIGETSKIIIIVLASFFPIYLNIDKGLKSVDPKLIDVGKAFNFDDFKILYKIIIPSAIPDILVGMRIGMGYSFRAIIGAEMIAASSGLGYMINFAKSMLHTDVVIVGIICIGLLGYISDEIFKILINYYLKDTKGNGWN